eukprot:GHVT01099750.1.p1 GENE.GHVT01099750.1~~GHVT01099750.1.p1  ORF type:complete len:764 (+),score=124.16 GHVT01099750.1:1332-3623(+)
MWSFVQRFCGLLRQSWCEGVPFVTACEAGGLFTSRAFVGLLQRALLADGAVILGCFYPEDFQEEGQDETGRRRRGSTEAARGETQGDDQVDVLSFLPVDSTPAPPRKFGAVTQSAGGSKWTTPSLDASDADVLAWAVHRLVAGRPPEFSVVWPVTVAAPAAAGVSPPKVLRVLLLAAADAVPNTIAVTEVIARTIASSIRSRQDNASPSKVDGELLKKEKLSSAALHISGQVQGPDASTNKLADSVDELDKGHVNMERRNPDAAEMDEVTTGARSTLSEEEGDKELHERHTAQDELILQGDVSVDGANDWLGEKTGRGLVEEDPTSQGKEGAPAADENTLKGRKKQGGRRRGSKASALSQPQVKQEAVNEIGPGNVPKAANNSADLEHLRGPTATAKTPREEPRHPRAPRQMRELSSDLEESTIPQTQHNKEQAASTSNSACTRGVCPVLKAAVASRLQTSSELAVWSTLCSVAARVEMRTMLCRATNQADGPPLTVQANDISQLDFCELLWCYGVPALQQPAETPGTPSGVPVTPGMSISGCAAITNDTRGHALQREVGGAEPAAKSAAVWVQPSVVAVCRASFCSGLQHHLERMICLQLPLLALRRFGSVRGLTELLWETAVAVQRRLTRPWSAGQVLPELRPPWLLGMPSVSGLYAAIVTMPCALARVPLWRRAKCEQKPAQNGSGDACATSDLGSFVEFLRRRAGSVLSPWKLVRPIGPCGVSPWMLAESELYELNQFGKETVCQCIRRYRITEQRYGL